MELIIIRASYDNYTVSIGGGLGSRPGVSASGLRQWLSKLGADEFAINHALDLGPDETIKVEIPDKHAAA